jgi:hypothetical protein
MPTALPTIGTLSYNGYTFNNTTRSRVRGELVYDRAGRAVVGTKYLFHVSTYVSEASPGAGCDAVVADLRVKLSHPGGEFRYQSKGLGDFEVNIGGTRDVAWGPKPRVIELEPVGSTACWRLVWVCEVMVPDCDGAAFSGVMAFNFGVSYTIDADRLQSRTYEGYLEIAMTRVGDTRAVIDTADAYREQISIPIPDGFQRAVERYTLSEDKRTLEFVVTDVELPSAEALPIGCTKARGRCSVQTTSPGLSQFTVSLSATYKVLKGQPRKMGYEAFYALYFDRLQWATTNTRGVTAMSFGVTEGLYEDSRVISFEMVYLVTSQIARIMADTGIWREVPRTAYPLWRASLGAAIGPRGFAGLRSFASEDVIVDLCARSSMSFAQTPSQPDRDASPGFMPEPTAPTVLDLKLGLQTEEEPSNVTHYPLPTAQDDGPTVSNSGLASNDQSFTDAPDIGTGQPGNNANVAPAQGPIPQRRGDDAFRVRLIGYALTTWEPAPCPQILRIGRATLVPADTHKYRTTFVGVLGVTPVYAATWDCWYRVIPPAGEKFKAPKVKAATPQKTPKPVLVIQPGRQPQYLPRSVVDELFS